MGVPFSSLEKAGAEEIYTKYLGPFKSPRKWPSGYQPLRPQLLWPDSNRNVVSDSKTLLFLLKSC